MTPAVIASKAKQSLLLLITIIAFGVAPFVAHAMLPGEMTGEHMEMEDMHESDAVTTVSDAPQLVCVQRTDPATGSVHYITATTDAASQLGGTSIAPGPCQSGEKPGRTRTTRYGIAYLPETLLRSGVPQSVLQTVLQAVLGALYSVLDFETSHRIHT
ncbi:MAG: hypothetical protein G01um101438_983 [Parcubacteria group bacterium Gr01-1014_38]|nr:MAG: hypothetical protein G01um101438_983 [Parcubacteria group bacterium Gr01-1014_38]